MIGHNSICFHEFIYCRKLVPIGLTLTVKTIKLHGLLHGVLLHAVMNKLKNSYTHFWKSKIYDDSKNQPNGNKLRTYRTFKICYERETYLFVLHWGGGGGGGVQKYTKLRK